MPMKCPFCNSDAARILLENEVGIATAVSPVDPSPSQVPLLMETCDSVSDRHQPPSTGNYNLRQPGKVIVAIHRTLPDTDDSTKFDRPARQGGTPPSAMPLGWAEHDRPLAPAGYILGRWQAEQNAEHAAQIQQHPTNHWKTAYTATAPSIPAAASSAHRDRQAGGDDPGNHEGGGQGRRHDRPQERESCQVFQDGLAGDRQKTLQDAEGPRRNCRGGNRERRY